MPIHFKPLSETRYSFEYVGAVTDEDVDMAQSQWLGAMRKADTGGRRLVLLVDGLRSEGPSAQLGQVTADFSIQHEGLIRRVCAAQAVLLESALQRGILTAIFWIKPPPTDLRVFKTRAECEAFLDEVERKQLVRSA